MTQKQVGKIWPESSKTPVNDETPVKLEVWHLLQKPLCTADPEISGCFLIQIAPLMFDLFKDIKLFKLNLKLTARSNNSAL